MDAAARGIFGNASSTHRAGQTAHEHLEKARTTVAGSIHASPNEIVFTSGGTEANNLAILGLVGPRRGHVVTTAIEHPSVLECCRRLKHTLVAPRDRISDFITPETVLVSVMHANNETGSIQDVAELGRRIRERRAGGQEIYLHSDGVQALGNIGVDVQALGVDLYSISAHKMFGPKGVGALYVRHGTPLSGIQFGGRHERGRRAGTENVPGAIAFARALKLARENDVDVNALRHYFEAEVLWHVADVEINGVGSLRLPNTSNLLFRGISAEALVIALDMQGMAVSTGSACSSGSIEPSHVLLAMGRSREEAKSSVRFSFGRYNTRSEVEQLIEAVISCIRRLRRKTRALETQLVS